MNNVVKRGDWLKRLRKWAPEYSGVRLYDLIHDEVLIKGQTFTKEKADDFKKGTDLLGDLFIAYEEFKAEPQMGERGPFSDMMGQWLCDVDGFNVRGGQFFTPIHICDFMASVGLSDDPVKLMEKPERMMDPGGHRAIHALNCQTLREGVRVLQLHLLEHRHRPAGLHLLDGQRDPERHPILSHPR